MVGATWRWVVVVAVSVAATAHADDRPESAERPLAIELPLLDAPRFRDLGGEFPTWRVSTDWVQATFELANGALHRGARHLGRAERPVEWLGGLLVLTLSQFQLGVLNPELAHEEGHRGVLARYGVHSTDLLNPFVASKQVSHSLVIEVTDADLAGLKARNPAAFARASAAGIETEIHLHRELEKDVFFSGQPVVPYLPFHLFNLASATYYFQRCLHVTPDDIQADADGPMASRDFTGPDCTAWVYDLSRPDEPYAARGTLPDGSIRRDRLTSDLTAGERHFLALTRTLAFLSFVDPIALGLATHVDVGGRHWRASAALEHQPTSFGGVVSLNGIARSRELRVFAAIRVFFNDSIALPGVSLEVVRYPLRTRIPLAISPRIDLWLQPRDFRRILPSLGGMVGIGVDTPLLGPVAAYVALDAKTPGWLSGNPSLGAEADAVVGLQLRI